MSLVVCFAYQASMVWDFKSIYDPRNINLQDLTSWYVQSIGGQIIQVKLSDKSQKMRIRLVFE